MGYPAYMLPREPVSPERIDSGDAEISKKMAAGWTREELLAGHPGESYWHSLPQDLKSEWLEFVERYEPSGKQNSVHALDDACFWFDMESRKCKHHEFRPRVCRDFEVGSEPCIEWRAEYEEIIP